MKLQQQLSQQKTQLEEVSQEKEHVLKENMDMAESLALERVRLQTQTAQFTKLVDYQHSTPIKRKGSFRKVLYAGRHVQVLQRQCVFCGARAGGLPGRIGTQKRRWQSGVR